MSGQQGFHVDLDSLNAFSQELTTQLSGMGQPLGQLQALTAQTIELGAFSEAKLLFHNQDTAAEKMSTLVGQARDAIGFAEEITKSVHSSYDHFDDEYNAKINAAGGIGGVVDSVTGGLTDGVDSTVDGLTNGIGGTVDGLTNGIGGTVDGLTNGLGDTLNGTGLLSPLTGGDPLTGGSGVDIIGALTGQQHTLNGGTGA